MKKVGILVLMLMLVLALPVFADSQIRVMVNDQYVNFVDSENNAVYPALVNDRTMVPFRFVAEQLGAEVQWDGETNTVYATRDFKTVALQIGSTKASVTKDWTKGNEEMTGLSYEAVELDAAPYIIDGRTMVPLRFISESFDCKVGWSQEEQTAVIVDISADTAELLNECSNFAKFVESIDVSDKSYFNMNMTIKLDGKGESYTDMMTVLNDTIKLNAFNTSDATYFNFSENFIKNGQTDLTNYYISIPVSTDEDIEEAVLPSSDSVAIGTYTQLKAEFDQVKELLNNKNFTIQENGDSTVYILDAKSFEIESEEEGIDSTTCDLYAKIKTVDNIAKNIDFNITVYEENNDYIKFLTTTDVSYSNTAKSTPSEENVVTLEELVMLILFSSIPLE